MENSALIIGGTGFIGHALCTQLLSQDIKTRVPISAKRLKKAWNEINDI